MGDLLQVGKQVEKLQGAVQDELQCWDSLLASPKKVSGFARQHVVHQVEAPVVDVAVQVSSGVLVFCCYLRSSPYRCWLTSDLIQYVSSERIYTPSRIRDPDP